MKATTQFLFALGLLAPLSAWATAANTSADTNVSSTSPLTNFGTAVAINVGGGNTGLIMFNLSSLPAGLTAANINKATMTLYVNTVAVAGSIDIGQVTSAWTESGVTNNTRPTYLSPFLMGVPITASRQYVTVDLTQLVRDWVSGAAQNYGVQISPAAAAPTTAIMLDSKENQTTSHPAFLDVVIQSVGPAGPTGPQGTPGATGPAGPTGPQGTAGAAGPTGPIGPRGPTGPTGTNGTNGANGLPGAQGPTGPTGPTGPQGIIAYRGIPNQGYGQIANPLPVVGATFTSLGHEVTVTVPANAKVLVSSTAVLGSTISGGASGLGLDQCYKPSGGSLSGGGYFVYIREGQNSASAHSITRIIGPLSAGTYSFGLCYATGNANWNANDYVQNAVIVFN